MDDSVDSVLPLKAKGDRPHFFDEPAIDTLTSMVLALAAELSVESDRNDALLRVLQEKGLLSADELRTYAPSPAVMAEREQRRQSMLNNVFRVVRQDVDGMQRKQAD